ncbi:SWIRM domain [Carpediemonas membranifera]|uniref:SWIRM domain n=1 Tax=Carpediemonas membranifera TaxID=201153 RepID=A0A8J6BVU0_9EUKA|nr:SWIRM domain [Carpediemonas membranifera]|eukprot:KAG9391746.1 SWIRM domain [Carpediemonas membranifera]
MARGGRTPKIKKAQKQNLIERLNAAPVVARPFDPPFKPTKQTVRVTLRSPDVLGRTGKRFEVREDLIDHLLHRDGSFGERALEFTEEEKLTYQIIWLENNLPPPQESEYVSEVVTPSAPPRRKAREKSEKKPPAPPPAPLPPRIEIRTEHPYHLPTAPVEESMAGYNARLFKLTMPAASGGRGEAVGVTTDMLPPPEIADADGGIDNPVAVQSELVKPTWYHRNTVSGEERERLPEWFNEGSIRCEENYILYRNFIIDAWSNRPAQILSLTAVRKAIPADVGAIHRLFDFLVFHGIINSGVDPSSDCHASRIGHLTVPPDMTVLPPLDSSEAPDGKTPAQSAPVLAASELELKRGNIHHTDSNRSLTEPKLTFHCNHCGADCSSLCYHGIRTSDYDLCGNCWAHPEIYKSDGLGPEDFVKVSGVVGKGTEWSREEVLLLLEGLETFGPDWDSIGEHVGAGRSKADCFRAFLSLPIIDTFLDGWAALPDGVKADSATADMIAPIVGCVGKANKDAAAEAARVYKEMRLPSNDAAAEVEKAMLELLDAEAGRISAVLDMAARPV